MLSPSSLQAMALTELWPEGSSLRPLTGLCSLLILSQDKVRSPPQQATLCRPLGNACSECFSYRIVTQVTLSDVYGWLFTLELSRMVYLKKRSENPMVTHTRETSLIPGTQALSLLTEKHGVGD